MTQWLIELEAPVDLTRLLRIEGDETRLIEGERAAAVLNGAVCLEDHSVSDTDVATPVTGVAEDGMEENNEDISVFPSAPLAEALVGKAAFTTARIANDALITLFDRVDALRIPREKFERYARKKYGVRWNLNANGIKRVLSAVESFKTNRGGLLAAIEAELGAVA